MFLFDKNEKSIFAYEFMPNHEKIREFKIQEMEKINDEAKLLKASTNSISYQFLDSSDKVFSMNVLNQKHPNKALIEIYHKIENENLSSKEIKDMMELYYNGKFEVYNPKKIIDNNKKDIYILPRFNYINNDGVHEMRNIINLTEKLYLYHLLRRGDFRMLHDVDIEEQVNLFDFNKKPVKKFNINKIRQLDHNFNKIGLYTNDNNYNKLDRCIENSKQILQYIKK